MAGSNLKVFIESFFSRGEIAKKARFKLINRLAKRLGFRLHSRRFSPWKNEEYLKVISEGKYPFNDKKFMIYQLAKAVASLEGDTVECGVFRGHGSWLILKAGGRTNRPHLLFDSFEGISSPEDGDNHPDQSIYQWEENDMAYPMEKVKEKFKIFPQVEYYKGWIPTRFAEVSDRKFSFVHIDVDLYRPTMDSIAFFYQRLQTGGIILCDDYGATGTPGAFRAMNEFFKDKPENPIFTIPGSGFIIKL